MTEIDVLKAQVVRQDRNTPWGFKLQGGADVDEPITIQRLAPGSPGAKIGLKAGDSITEVGDVQTEHLTLSQALDLIDQHGDTIVLTVERKARGSIPIHPVISSDGDADRMKGYQTYDMSGGKQHTAPPPTYIPALVVDKPMHGHPAAPQPSHNQAPGKSYQTYDINGPRAPVPSGPQHDYQFHTVTAKPFEEQPRPMFSSQAPRPVAPPPAPMHCSPPPPPPPQPQRDYPSPAADMMYQDPHQPYYYGEEAPEDPNIHQSRTFKTLASLMQNDEPAAGVAGLPPPRSVAQEQWKQQQAAKQASPRVKVFMPQQYNSPLGMYSAKNVVETFQAQAETMMDAMERAQFDDGDEPVAQQAVVGN